MASPPPPVDRRQPSVKGEVDVVAVTGHAASRFSVCAGGHSQSGILQPDLSVLLWRTPLSLSFFSFWKSEVFVHLFIPSRKKKNIVYGSSRTNFCKDTVFLRLFVHSVLPERKRK